MMIIMHDNTETTSAIYDEMKRLAAVIHEDIISRRLDQMLSETQGILRWLSPVDSDEDYHKANRDRVPGTGRWFFDSAFEAWAEDGCRTPILWITGKCKSASFSHTQPPPPPTRILLARASQARCQLLTDLLLRTAGAGKPPSCIALSTRGFVSCSPRRQLTAMQFEHRRRAPSTLCSV